MNKGTGTTAMVGNTVNGLIANPHRLLLGINVEMFRGPVSETDEGHALLEAFPQKHPVRIQTVGANKGYFAKYFLTALVRLKFPRVLDDHFKIFYYSEHEDVPRIRGHPYQPVLSLEDHIRLSMEFHRSLSSHQGSSRRISTPHSRELAHHLEITGGRIRNNLAVC